MSIGFLVEGIFKIFHHNNKKQRSSSSIDNEMSTLCQSQLDNRRSTSYRLHAALPIRLPIPRGSSRGKIPGRTKSSRKRLQFRAKTFQRRKPLSEITGLNSRTRSVRYDTVTTGCSFGGDGFPARKQRTGKKS